MPEKPAAPSTHPAYERRVLEDIAKGRWNTGSRYLDTKGHLTANQYAQAALRGVPPYSGRAEARDE